MTTEEPKTEWSLRKAIRSTIDYGNHVIETGRAHSPLNEHKLAAADEKVTEAIHGMSTFYKLELI